MTDPVGLVSGVRNGEAGAIARAISAVEDRTDGYRNLVGRLHRVGSAAHVVGVTGSPGVGKSTLVDALVSVHRSADRSVGVLAIDPSSPTTSGSVLGDRVRIGAGDTDTGVFVRSMSTRGALGGISPATADAITILEAANFDAILVETVGAGQSEVDVATLADTVAVVVQPHSGDHVQMLKAGILEIGDIFAVNKADLDDVDSTVRELRSLVSEGHAGDDLWTPPICETVATTGQGVASLLDAADDHHDWLVTNGTLDDGRRDQYAERVRSILRDDIARVVSDRIDETPAFSSDLDTVVARTQGPYQVAADLLADVTDA